MNMKKGQNLIVFAHYPSQKEANCSGMLARFLSIDSIFEDIPRYYIESTLSTFKQTIYTILRDLKHHNYLNAMTKYKNVKRMFYVKKSTLEKMCEDANVIYVQTIYNMLNIPVEIIKNFGHKMFFDIHGCFVEESEYLGWSQRKISRQKEYEKQIFKYVKNFVCVSQNMVDFYKDKFSSSKDANYMILPIFSLNKDAKCSKICDDKKINIIYPGGCDKWQNSELMVETIAKLQDNKEYHFAIYTKQIKEFSKLLDKYSIKNVNLEYKSQKELWSEYKKYHFGFLLRDDIIVNKVACPTKLIDYLQNGIIPIVLQPEIGDFNKFGYKYILLTDFIEGKIPNEEEQEKMRKVNFEIIQNLSINVEYSKNKLLSMILGN